MNAEDSFQTEQVLNLIEKLIHKVVRPIDHNSEKRLKNSIWRTLCSFASKLNELDEVSGIQLLSQRGNLICFF
jgi:hypothetical protein